MRWARDLGSDDYNLPGYWKSGQGGRRWSYYRLNSHSHNVLLFDDGDQAVAGRAEFTAFESEADAAHAILEIDGAWPGLVESLQRGVALVDGRSALVVQDEFELRKRAQVLWGMTTDATIDVTGSRAVLRQDGESLMAEIQSPTGAVFEVESAERAAPEKRNRGVRRLVVRGEMGPGPGRIRILFHPLPVESRPRVGIEPVPLSDW